MHCMHKGGILVWHKKNWEQRIQISPRFVNDPSPDIQILLDSLWKLRFLLMHTVFQHFQNISDDFFSFDGMIPCNHYKINSPIYEHPVKILIDCYICFYPSMVPCMEIMFFRHYKCVTAVEYELSLFLSFNHF